MLILKPNCELCDKELLATSSAAKICSYECTFCAHCVETVLNNVCPNCGGGFTSRPIRPSSARRKGVSLVHHPAATERTLSKYTEQEIRDFAQTAAHIEPKDR